MKPLTLTADMALAAILGPKTETRRPVKPQPILDKMESFGPSWSWNDGGNPWFSGVTEQQMRAPYGLVKFGPFGPVGTELWLREPGRVVDGEDVPSDCVKVRYAADGKSLIHALPERFRNAKWVEEFKGIPNGIFREAARYFFVVTEVRVERLWDITDIGAKSEGFINREAFLCAWEDIYGQRPGLRAVLNPWVSVTAWDKMVAI